MQHRQLGQSGLYVSELAFGNWITHASQIADDAALTSVHAALDAGITTFDTADAYADTAAESVLGRALAGQRREGLEIFTKVFWPTGPGMNDRSLSRKHIMESCHASLRRLGVDYIDVYQAHRFDHNTPLVETLRAFDDLVRQGKILYVGVSEWRASEIKQAMTLADELGFDRIVCNQPQYSMLWRVPEAEVFPTGRQYGLGQIVWSPMAQGVLTGKYTSVDSRPSGSRVTSSEGASFVSRWLQADVLDRVAALAPIAADLGLTSGQLALAWVLANNDVSAAIIGASRPQQVVENVVASGVKLAPDVLTAIDTVLGDVARTDPELTQSPKERP